jgi:hypothetical protein
MRTNRLEIIKLSEVRGGDQKVGRIRFRRNKGVTCGTYGALQKLIRTGQPYETRLDPPPADPAYCHLAKAQSPKP